VPVPLGGRIFHHSTTANTAKHGHSKVYAQLSPLPPSARSSCHQVAAVQQATTKSIVRCSSRPLRLSQPTWSGGSYCASASVLVIALLVIALLVIALLELAP